MAARDVYIELFLIFVISFLILTFAKNIGEQLVFMLIAFILSGLLENTFTSGIKGVINHPLITKGSGMEAKAEQLHEKKYIFFLFFLFVVASALIGSGVSNYILNDVVYPSIGSVQGALLISGIITLVLYMTMLWTFGERLINPTSAGLLVILVVIVLLFIFFSGYTNSVVNYFSSSFHTLTGFLR